MRCTTLSQLLWVPTVSTEKLGSVLLLHNDSAEAIFIGCCWNISLPCTSPVKNSPARAANATRQPRMVAGRYMVRASSLLPARTIHHAQIAATNVPAVRKAPATVCETAATAVLLLNSAAMLVSSARPVSGL